MNLSTSFFFFKECMCVCKNVFRVVYVVHVHICMLVCVPMFIQRSQKRSTGSLTKPGTMLVACKLQWPSCLCHSTEITHDCTVMHRFWHGHWRFQFRSSYLCSYLLNPSIIIFFKKLFSVSNVNPRRKSHSPLTRDYTYIQNHTILSQQVGSAGKALVLKPEFEPQNCVEHLHASSMPALLQSVGDGDRENHQKAHGPPSLEVAAQKKQQRFYTNKDI